MKWIHNAIIATDLAQFGENKKVIEALLSEGTFSWDNNSHR